MKIESTDILYSKALKTYSDFEIQQIKQMVLSLFCTGKWSFWRINSMRIILQLRKYLLVVFTSLWGCVFFFCSFENTLNITQFRQRKKRSREQEGNTSDAFFHLLANNGNNYTNKACLNILGSLKIFYSYCM